MNSMICFFENYSFGKKTPFFKATIPAKTFFFDWELGSLFLIPHREPIFPKFLENCSQRAVSVVG